jgi:hypothetical protein
MKHTLRCHDLGQVRACDSCLEKNGLPPTLGFQAKIAPAHKGLRPESPARRREEQGSAQRGAGTRLRDATVEPIKGASFQCRSHARLGGQIPRGAPRPPLDAPRLRGCDRAGVHRTAVLARLCPVPGSHPSTKRLEPAPPSAGPLSLGLPISTYWLHLASCHRRFRLAPHARFIMLLLRAPRS